MQRGKQQIQRKTLLWGILLLLGGALHMGTALLRLKAFFPYRPPDFASFYAAAWLIRKGVSPYPWPQALLEQMHRHLSLPLPVPTHHSPPLWSLLLQPFTFFSYPLAAWLWLLLQLLLLGWSAHALAQTAQIPSKLRWLFGVILLTFGPTVLTLTLGQNNLVLLAASLLVAQASRHRSPADQVAELFAWLSAVAAKLFPLPWVGHWLFVPQLRRRLALAILSLGLAVGITYALAPQASVDYWFHFLQQRTNSLSQHVGLDDQSLAAVIDRLSYTHTYQVPGLSPSETRPVVWEMPWNFSAAQARWFSLLCLIGLGGVTLFIVWRAAAHPTPAALEGATFLWVLYWLLPFPHMERYNLVLLLPAMAWLWGQDEGGKHAAILAYLLVGCSRLNHLWAMLLPSPLNAIASGCGLYATLWLMGHLAFRLRGFHFPNLEMKGPYETPD